MNARTCLSQNNKVLHQPSRNGKRCEVRSTRRNLLNQERELHCPTRKRSQPSRNCPQLSLLNATDQDSLLRQRSLSEAREGNYASALAGLTLLIERNPHSAQDLNNRGLVYLQAGQPMAALTDYNQALKLNPRMASIYNNRANYYVSQGQLAEAIIDYETAIDLDPTNIRAWINQGITFRDLDMHLQAIENFDQALYIFQLVGRHSTEAILLECHIYAQRGRTHQLEGDWNCAIADYHRALGLLTPSNQGVAPGVERLYLQVSDWLSELLSPLE